MTCDESVLSLWAGLTYLFDGSLQFIEVIDYSFTKGIMRQAQLPTITLESF